VTLYDAFLLVFVMLPFVAFAAVFEGLFVCDLLKRREERQHQART
jgi:hypothetical protein